MNRAGLFWSGLALAMLGAAVVWRQQQDERVRLHAELAHTRALTAEGEQMVDRNERLARALPSPAEMDGLRAVQAELSSGRAELASLQSELASTRRTSGTVPGAERFVAKSVIPSGEWQNVGNATSKATLETVLWAAAGGDVEAFAKNLSVPEGKARERAIALWETLPASLRATTTRPSGCSRS